MMLTIDFQHLPPDYPVQLIASLQTLKRYNMPLFLAGGAVRDLLRGVPPTDLDLTVPSRALDIARCFASKIKGVFVLLDEQAEVARVVWHQFFIDFSSFREDATNIQEDLKLRDFTINAMALPFNFDTGCFGSIDTLIDPLGGLEDLHLNLIRYTSEEIFNKDPLRLLRAYRFNASLGFTLNRDIDDAMRICAELIAKVSAERISHELNIIISSQNPSSSFVEMAGNGLLFILFPELEKGKGLMQPSSHHLDVYLHNLAALSAIEKILMDPIYYFGDQLELIFDYIASEERRKWLKWAALFHDIGKPSTFQFQNDRITFYDHDNKGAEIFIKIAKRLKWSNRDTLQVSKLIKLHMWPFHLNNARAKTGIKSKACLKLHKAIGDDLAGLFILAMADSLAADGVNKPAAMENDLISLLELIVMEINEKIMPVSNYPPVITGNDLINELKLSPGPIFGEIMKRLEEEQISSHKMTKEEAIKWVRQNYKL